MKVNRKSKSFVVDNISLENRKLPYDYEIEIRDEIKKELRDSLEKHQSFLFFNEDVWPLSAEEQNFWIWKDLVESRKNEGKKSLSWLSQALILKCRLVITIEMVYVEL